MNPAELYQSALDDLATLLRATATGPRRTVTLSPDVAEMSARLNPVPERGNTPAPATGDPVSALAALATTVSTCEQCSLCKTRTQTVFGVGNPHAELVFVGEAPGADEDAQGEPFVGKAGALLTDIIVKGMKMRREDVYICNVLKCRPPGNRNPNPQEMALCEPFLKQQLAAIKPRVICALGGVAAKCLLKTEETVGSLRGRWHNYEGIPLRVTYHPAYLLRTPGDKRKTWEDVQEVMKVLSGETTPKV